MNKEEIAGFCEEIVECLMLYGDMDEAVARELLDLSNICKVQEEMNINILFHELPYYWAMRLLHPNNPQWHQDHDLWPPPQIYLDKYYKLKRPPP